MRHAEHETRNSTNGKIHVLSRITVRVIGMIGSLDENGRKTDLLMAPDVKCTRREPNNTHLLSVIDLANILKFGHESSSFTGYSIFTLTFHL